MEHAARTAGLATAATGTNKQIARLIARMIFMPGIGINHPGRDSYSEAL